MNLINERHLVRELVGPCNESNVQYILQLPVNRTQYNIVDRVLNTHLHSDLSCTQFNKITSVKTKRLDVVFVALHRNQRGNEIIPPAERGRLKTGH